MKIVFVTTNKHKFQEVRDVLKDYPVELEQLDMEYEENHDDQIEDIARDAVKKLANELNKPVILEDTGLFFEAYDGFPGALPKFVYNTLGYKGIFKLLENEKRDAYFKTVAAYCKPGEEAVLFEGVMKGVITEKVYNQDKDAMPYDRIFIPEGKTKTISEMSLEEKNSFSQRAKAFKEFGEYITKHKLI
ncbi:XTP/dITP diphosphatase [Candidatus Falkowbacteria bacterium]|jgi:XTP/dITP diphosphohydrolase|nr:XTP/dITP diphosphatase [Candidatus Falkowbacteria bacterium]MBT4433142.1 XTP/dITP diphosphatase [Candidatus Falkowbacteria bacterium]